MNARAGDHRLTPALALTALSVVAAWSFARVFTGASAAVPAVAGALVAHGAGMLGRARRWPPAAVLAAAIAGLVLAAAWSFAASTTVAGIPTAATFRTLAHDLTRGARGIRTSSVPVGAGTGLPLLAMLATWVDGLAADWIAFRAGATLAATVPALTVFTLTATLGARRHGGELAAAFVVAAAAFVMAQAPALTGDRRAWFTAGGRRSPGRGLVAAGLPLLAAAGLAAPLLGPRLPEARSQGLVDWAGSASGGPRTRVTVSPLVDIRDRLTRTPPVQLFTVRADRPAYWRLTALDTFDGRIWSSLATYQRAEPRLPATDDVSPAVTVRQRFRIDALGQFWLPAAYHPVSIDLRDVRANPDTLTLLTDRPTADGLEYSVVSEVPAYSQAQLASAPGIVPDAVRRDVALPPGFPAEVRDLAGRVVAGRSSAFEKGLALQEFFRRDFRYSEQVPAGHSVDALRRFLFVDRAGFCEQFSAAFAAMARSIGLPSRVAVGFTPGTFDQTNGRYVVTTREAHAWPEVYLAPYGWVAFEPTPGRSQPSPTNYTGTFDPRAVSVPTTQPATVTTQAPAPAPRPPAGAGGVATGRKGLPAAWVRRVLAVVAGALAAGVAYALAALSARHRRAAARRRVRERRHAVLAAWTETVERLREAGVAVTPAQTPSEVAGAAGAVAGARVVMPLAGLATLVDAATYAPVEPSDADVGAAWRAAEEAVAVLDAVETTPARVRRLVGPRAFSVRSG